MKQYHKIQTVFKRDMSNKGKIIDGNFSLPEFDLLKEVPWVWTEKVDGTNIRVMWDGKDVVFAGKTDNAQIPSHLIKSLQDMFLGTANRQKLAAQFGDSDAPLEVCLYGEGYGPKIQSGGKYREDASFVLFDVKVGNWWLLREDVEDVASNLGLDIVPILGEGTLLEAIDYVRGGFKSEWGDFESEGLVLRPKVELKTRRGDRIITKIKCCDFK